eukprot:1156204-Pelagomonas_calceolata.AAC.7
MFNDMSYTVLCLSSQGMPGSHTKVAPVGVLEAKCGRGMFGKATSNVFLLRRLEAKSGQPYLLG